MIYRQLLILCSSWLLVRSAEVSPRTNGEEARSLAAKEEMIVKVLPGQYIGSIVQSHNHPTQDWFLPVESKANAIIEEGFVPPTFDFTSEHTDFPALQLNNSTNEVNPIHVIIRRFPTLYHPLLVILASTRCSSSPSANSKLQSRVALLLNLKNEVCFRNHAQQRISLVRALTQYFSQNLANYWWLATSPTIQDPRLAKMVMTMLEGNGSLVNADYTDCTLVLPIGCGARVPGNYIDSVVKLQDDFASFPEEIRTLVQRWSVKIFDPLMLPVLSLGNEARKASDSKLLLRNPRNRHRRNAFGLNRGNSFLESYQLSDYMNDESWALENRLALDASSGDGISGSQTRPQQPDVFDVLTMVATTPSFGDDVDFVEETEIRSSTVVLPVEKSTSQSSLEEGSRNNVENGFEQTSTSTTTSMRPVVNGEPKVAEELTLETSAIVDHKKNFPAPIATSTQPPTPWPEFSEDSLFITQNRILHYPIRRRFESLADLSEITFLLAKCASPTNGEPVTESCRKQTTSTDDWLYYNSKFMALEGIVPSSAESTYIFNLTGYSKTRARSFIIRIAVAPSSKNPQIADRTHEFCLHLKWKAVHLDSSSDVVASQLRMREQVQIARVLTSMESATSKMTLDDIVVMSVSHSAEAQAARRHLTAMCFSQLNLTPVDSKRCPRPQFSKQLGHLVKLPATWADKTSHHYSFAPSARLAVALHNGSNYDVSKLGFNLYNACKSLRMDANTLLNATSFEAQVAQEQNTGNKGVVAGDIWLTLVIPGAVLLCMLLMAVVVACVLYRCIRRKSHSKKTKKGTRVAVGNTVFLTKGAPAIFQEELDTEVPGPTRLLISADNRDQYSGGEGSEHDGADTASSSAPGGSPGRLHGSEPNVRRAMVPPTPPPPEYRLHHNRSAGAQALPSHHQTRHDDASSPESRELSEEMAELSQPLLVKQNMVTSIQTVGTMA